MQQGVFWATEKTFILSLPIAFKSQNYIVVTGDAAHVPEGDIDGYDLVSGIDRKEVQRIVFSTVNLNRDVYWLTIGF